ncbi:MAG: PAS domain S-box protein [Marinilabiliales bacterium]|nr:PAS domain S-box protein [Marinilabiliales bacterium]
MSKFLHRIFDKKSEEFRLLFSLIPLSFLLILLDEYLDKFSILSDQNHLNMLILKLFASSLLSILITFLFFRILDYRLRRSDEAAILSRERFRLIFENNTSSILIINAESHVIMINDAYCEMTGFTREEVIGQSWLKLIPPHEAERLLSFNQRRLAKDPGVPSHYELDFITRTGEVRVGMISVFYEDTLHEYVISVNDISERKAIENSLRESEEKYKNLINIQGEGLGILNRELRYIFANPAADKIMGVDQGGLIGRRLDEFVTTESMLTVKKETELHKAGSQSTYELEFVRPDGAKRVMLITTTPTFSDKGDYENSLSIFLDITDRKNIENELIRNEAELKALNTTKDKLFSIIAHDLRGPVGTSADLLEVMIESYDSFSQDEQLKMLEILRNSARSTYNLLETLLNWAVIQTGNLVFRPEIFNLTKTVDNIVKNLVPTAFSKNISLIFDATEDIYIFGDQNMIQTVFRNLIGNSIKYTYRGGMIEVKILNHDHKTEVLIVDNGVGMDETTKNNLFILNKQHSKYGTENEKGTGLGLILCKEFLEKHGGSIRVESEPEKGSCFIFDIPKIHNRKEKNDETAQPKPEHKQFNQETILIVEDEDINYQVLRSILTSMNLNYERAENGKDAVTMFLKNNYSLILMDVQLPEMNGWEATMKIRENDADIPIIAVTAYASDPTRKKSMEAGCNDFVTKPINKTRLVQIIDKYLKRSRITTFQ